MIGFVFVPRYNSPGSPEMTRMGNPTRCFVEGNVPQGQTPTHTCDATNSFRPTAATFHRIHKIGNRILIFDNHLPAARRASSIFDSLASYTDNSIEIIAYFGHGIPTGLESAAIGRRNFERFAALTQAKCAAGATIVFYACSTGASGGFCDQLAERLTQKSVRVFGHTGPGHYLNMSMFRQFPGRTQIGGMNDYPLTFWRQPSAPVDAAPSDAKP